MKILFYSVNTLMKVPNFAAELDIMKAYLDQGHEVYVLRCLGELNSCLVNKSHWKSTCYLCQSRFKRGMKLLDIPETHLLDFLPDLSYKSLPQRFDRLEDLLAFEVEGADLGAAVAASIAGELKDHKFDTHHYADLISKKLKMAYLVYASMKQHLQDIQPERVYIYNGRIAETRPALKASINAGIPAYTIERAGSMGRYNLFENTIPLDISFFTQDIQKLWEAGDSHKEALATQFYQERRASLDQGEPSFTKKQQKQLLPENFNPDLKNIALFNGSEYEFAGLPDWQNPLYPDQNAAIFDVVEALKEAPNLKIWLRVHPNITFAKNVQLLELQQLEAKQYPHLEIIWPNSKVDSYALMDACDTVLTFGSTMGVESTFWGKPSVMAGRSFYQELGCCYIPENRAHLIDLLKTDLAPANREGALIYGYGLMTNGIPFQTFNQTALHEGDFLGETFQLHQGVFDFSYYYLLRKMDKLAEKLRKNQHPTAKV